VNRFLHIGFNFMERPITPAELAPVFNKAIDWVRYAPNCWVVYTASEPVIWYQRLRPAVSDKDTFFICEIVWHKDEIAVPNGISCSGYLPAYVWEWISRYSAGVVATIPPLLPDSGA
jgi:hypothetical protein